MRRPRKKSMRMIVVNNADPGVFFATHNCTLAMATARITSHQIETLGGGAFET